MTKCGIASPDFLMMICIPTLNRGNEKQHTTMKDMKSLKEKRRKHWVPVSLSCLFSAIRMIRVIRG